MMPTPFAPHPVVTASSWPDVPGASRRRRALGRPEVELSADVVVVGSGAGGAVMAAELAEGGLDVLLLEEGSYHRTADFNTAATAMVRKLYRDGGLTMALGNPPVLYSEGRCVGGSTTVNGGMSWRTPERVLERWARDERVDDLMPARMEPYFARVERFISARYQDPETIGRDNALLREGAERKGWHVIPNIRNQVHCAGSNNCAFGCPTGAKQSTLVSYVPRALAFGARVFADCRVERVVRRAGRVEGVTGRVSTPDGRSTYRFTARAPRVVLSAGAVQTPVLLQRSGIRSPSRQIGHNLALHPNAKVVAIFDEVVDGYKGAHQVYQVREFEDQGLLMAAVNVPPAVLAMSIPRYGGDLQRLMVDYHRMVSAGVLVEDSSSGRVRAMPGGRPLVLYQLTERDAAQLVRGVALLCELLLAAGARRIILPFDGLPDVRDGDDVRRLASARIPRSSMEVMSVHLMCTARMGGDDRRHVCDPQGRVYGTAGLYIADASVFPSPIGVNPMETIMALATRSAEHLLAEPPGPT